MTHPHYHKGTEHKYAPWLRKPISMTCRYCGGDDGEKMMDRSRINILARRPLNDPTFAEFLRHSTRMEVKAALAQIEERPVVQQRRRILRERLRAIDRRVKRAVMK